MFWTIEYIILPTSFRLAPVALAKRSLSRGTYADPRHYCHSSLRYSSPKDNLISLMSVKMNRLDDDGTKIARPVDV